MKCDGGGGTVSVAGDGVEWGVSVKCDWGKGSVSDAAVKCDGGGGKGLVVSGVLANVGAMLR